LKHNPHIDNFHVSEKGEKKNKFDENNSLRMFLLAESSFFRSMHAAKSRQVDPIKHSLVVVPVVTTHATRLKYCHLHNLAVRSASESQHATLETCSS
jgi:hypothetical protein